MTISAVRREKMPPGSHLVSHSALMRRESVKDEEPENRTDRKTATWKMLRRLRARKSKPEDDPAALSTILRHAKGGFSHHRTGRHSK